MNSTTASATPPSTPLRRPPGPRPSWWGFPLLRAMRRDYLGFTARLQREHGDITYMRLVNEQAYDIFSPELVRELLVDNADALIRWERGIEVFEQLMGQSVLVTEGATWQRQRRMLQPGFTPKRVAGYAELMRDAAQTALDQVLPPGQAEGMVDMSDLFNRLAMDVILRTLFSSRADGESARAIEATQQLSVAAFREMFMPFTLPDWLPLPGKAAKRRGLRVLRQLVGGHIAARRQASGAGQPAEPDLLGMLLALRDEATGESLTDQEVFDQCMVTFQAGHETTATALLWWSRLMGEHRDALVRAQAEVDSVLQGRAPEAADMARLPWLSATLKEAMRLYPPIAALMTRRTTRQITLAGWTIPKGAMVRITPWVVQRDARHFEQPGRFMPERFMDGASSIPRGAWGPFGTGPRVCIGQHFAMLEMTLAAAMLLQRYDMRLPAGSPPPEPALNVTLRPRNGVRLYLARRPGPIAARA